MVSNCWVFMAANCWNWSNILASALVSKASRSCKMARIERSLSRRCWSIMCAIEFASRLLMFSTSSWNLCSNSANICLDLSDRGGKGLDCPGAELLEEDLCAVAPGACSPAVEACPSASMSMELVVVALETTPEGPLGPEEDSGSAISFAFSCSSACAMATSKEVLRCCCWVNTIVSARRSISCSTRANFKFGSRACASCAFKTKTGALGAWMPYGIVMEV